MTKIFALLTLLVFFTPKAFSYIGPSPELNCRDLSTRIPESQIVVQVYGKSVDNPNALVLVQRKDMNQEDQILFEGEASEINEVAAKVYVASGLRMKLVESNEGKIQGVVSVQEDQNVQHYPLECQVIYNLMPANEAM